MKDAFKAVGKCIVSVSGDVWTFKQDAPPSPQGLQRSGNDQTLEHVLSELFQVVQSPTADFKPDPSHCRSCAVVGNSGKLRHSGNGKLIDSHESVIRYVLYVQEDSSSSCVSPLLLPHCSSSQGWTRRWPKDLRRTLGIRQHTTSCTRRARWTSNMASASFSCRSNWETWSGWPARSPLGQSKCRKTRKHAHT